MVRKQTTAALEVAERKQSKDAAAGIDAAHAARSGSDIAAACGKQSTFVAYAGQLAVAPGSAMVQSILAVLLLTRLGIPTAVQEMLGTVSSMALLASVASVGLGSRGVISRYQVFCSYIVREKIASMVGANHWYSLVIDEASPKFGDAKTMVAISCYCPAVARHPILLDALPILRSDARPVTATVLARIIMDTVTAFRFDLRKCTMLITDNVDTMGAVARTLGLRHMRCHGHVFSLVANALVCGVAMKPALQLLTSITGYMGHSHVKKLSFFTACGVSHKQLSTANTRWCTVLDALSVLLENWVAIRAWLDAEAGCARGRAADDDDGERSSSTLLARAIEFMATEKLRAIIKLTLAVAAGLSLATKLSQATLLSDNFARCARKMAKQMKLYTAVDLRQLKILARDTLTVAEGAVIRDDDLKELALRAVEAEDKFRHLAAPSSTTSAERLTPLSTSQFITMATSFLPAVMAKPDWRMPEPARLRDIVGYSIEDARGACEQLERLRDEFAELPERPDDPLLNWTEGLLRQFEGKGYDLAIDTCRYFATVMTSSASVERIFSMMSEAHRSRLHRLKSESVRVRLMTRCNAEIVSLVLCMPNLMPAPPVAYNRLKNAEATSAAINPRNADSQFCVDEDSVDDGELAGSDDELQYESLVLAHERSGTADDGSPAETMALATVRAAIEPISVCYSARCMLPYVLTLVRSARAAPKEACRSAQEASCSQDTVHEVQHAPEERILQHLW